jgi:EAL domain-containing protein (putative c-di-GMP-specific phosphodiesterase class I)
MSEETPRCLPSVNSAFQPILSLAHQTPVGHEALLRSSLDGKPCSPLDAFRHARLAGLTGEFERECVRCHTGHFVRFADDKSILFINAQPEVLTHPIHGPGLVADILACGIPPARVAIEILETPQPRNGVLADAVAQLRLHGFLIALDDFGAGETNLSRVWDLQPDVVKLDRELIRQAATSHLKARSLLRLVGLLHEIGTLVAVEGVETEAEALLCLDCDADFAQGYYFGRPLALADKSDLQVYSAGFPLPPFKVAIESNPLQTWPVCNRTGRRLKTSRIRSSRDGTFPNARCAFSASPSRFACSCWMRAAHRSARPWNRKIIRCAGKRGSPC